MKKIILAIFAIGMAMASCNQNEWAQEKDSSFSSTRSDEWVVDYEALDTACFVSESDIEAYIHFKQLLAKGKGKEFEVLEVAPLGLDDRTTLCYLLNYNEGWEIIAADKRAPVVLATGETGNFSLEEAPDNVMAWIEGLENDVLYLRTFVGRPETADDETWDKMLSTMDFWKAINADEEFIERNSKPQTRSVPDTLPLDPPGGDEPFPFLGHWELAGVAVEENAYYDTGHLIPVSWGGNSGYNAYCPSYDTYYKAPAGCVAVAGGEMLYYLHYKIGIPSMSPSSIYCTATVGNVVFGTNMYIVSYSNSLWSSMKHYQADGTQTGSIDPVAKLLAGVGILSNMQYGNNASGTTYQYLINGVFTPLGISCLYDDYNASLAVNEIVNRDMPVLFESTAGTANGTERHAFVIDRCVGTADKYTYTYEWVYDEPSLLPRPILEDIQIEYQNVDITQIGFRWGMQGSFDGTLYQPTGIWSNAYYMVFNYDRKMIYNFTGPTN